MLEIRRQRRDVGQPFADARRTPWANTNRQKREGFWRLVRLNGMAMYACAPHTQMSSKIK